MNRKKGFRRWLAVVWAAGLLISALAVNAFAQEDMEYDSYWGNRFANVDGKWKVTASVNPDDAKYAIDNQQNTAWRVPSAKAGDYFELDLGEVQKVTRLEWYTDALAHYGWGGEGLEKAYPQKFRIDVSVDGTNWTTVVDQAGKGAYEPGEYLLQAVWKPVDARYIRVVVTENQATPLSLGHLLVWREGQMVQVTILNYVYFPNVLLVSAGTTVEWINLDPDGHTVTEGEPPVDFFESPDQRIFNSAHDWSMMFEGDRYSFTFTAEHANRDRIRYFCIPHPDTMIAWVKVVNL